MIKFIKKHLFVDNPYKEEFTKMNTMYNNKAASFSAAIYIVLVLVILVIGNVSKSEEFDYIIPIYTLILVLSCISMFILTFLRKKKMADTWQSEFFAILQISLCIVLMLVSGHVEIPATGIKNINAIILVMFAVLFFLRFKLIVILTLEVATTITVVVLLMFEKNDISNFIPSIVNIVTAGILSCISGYLYWRSRIQNYIMSNNFKKLATSDALTKVFNRRGLDSFFSRSWNDAVKNNGKIAMFIIDIDYFKRYNDFYGHIKGDECLSRVAEILSSSIRENDFIARYGGEEFAVIMIDTDFSAANSIAEKIFRNINESNIPHINSLVSQNLTISIGCMVANPAADGMTKQEFMEKADEALYQAKEQGRNQIVFHSQIKK